MTNNEINASPIHKFEAAGLGKAPFRFVGSEYKTFQACQGAPAQCGGSCMYCGTGISNFYYIKSSDGKLSHVGSECVIKSGDKELSKSVKNAAAKNNAKRKADKEASIINAALESLKNEAVRKMLSSKPHPCIKGMSLLDYIEYVFKFGGTKGKLGVSKMVAELLS